MNELKFRAVIRRKGVTVATVFFDLHDMIRPLFSVRELVIPWLREGHEPDRYTGPKDKNGVEIYEGDVIYAPGHCGKQVVKYGVGYAAAFTVGGYLLGVIDETDIEIIGNIHDGWELVGQHE